MDDARAVFRGLTGFNFLLFSRASDFAVSITNSSRLGGGLGWKWFLSDGKYFPKKLNSEESLLRANSASVLRHAVDPNEVEKWTDVAVPLVDALDYLLNPSQFLWFP